MIASIKPFCFFSLLLISSIARAVCLDGGRSYRQLSLRASLSASDTATISTPLVSIHSLSAGSKLSQPAPTQTATPYRLKAPPLDTPWTYDVGTNPWPQHPRPQLYREHWHSLNGIWTYQPASSPDETSSPPSYPLMKEVLIPSCIESGISGLMESNVTDMWFATTFTIPEAWAKTGAKQVLLNFEAVDNQATVFVNGVSIGSNVGGYWRFTLDITGVLNLHRPNEL